MRRVRGRAEGTEATRAFQGPAPVTRWVQNCSLLARGLIPKRSLAGGEFLFEIDPEPMEECLTALGGVPLLVRAIRSLDVPGSVKRNLHLKQCERGFDEATYVESFLVLNAVGGDCLDHFKRLAETSRS